MNKLDREILLEDAYVAGYNDGWLGRQCSPATRKKRAMFREYMRGYRQGSTESRAVSATVEASEQPPF